MTMLSWNNFKNCENCELLFLTMWLAAIQSKAVAATDVETICQFLGKKLTVDQE